jgi:ATPase subunit of ABC transporter with duplicated ATPase domains
VVAVSHDRYLLGETVEEIAELEGGEIKSWPGNYSPTRWRESWRSSVSSSSTSPSRRR